ncbi:polysaccharide deacetylase family protein [Herbiconiux sp.]|uniref:polysaccharide deacetylase family protein n=1 Tax=Herbiconiux sp. TaxID=1871186 RepID=UPI0025B9A7E2|nr:polysaccharide deacetylase family protein [Herbiconiux sp.]
MSVLVVGALAGCASIGEAPAWSPHAGAPAELAITGTSDPASGSGLPTPAPSVDASGIDVRMLYSANTAAPLAARWGEIPGNPAFTDLLRGRVTAAIAEQSGLAGAPYTPAADAPDIAPENRGCVPGSTTRPVAELLADPALSAPGEGLRLTITCEILAAAGTLLVESLRITTATGDQITSDQSTVYYADTAGAFVITSDTFVTDDGLRALLPRLVQSLKAGAGALDPAMHQSVDDFPLDQLRTWFSHLAFAPDGALVVTVPAGFGTPELDALASWRAGAGADGAHPPFTITVPAADATALLSEQGTQVQAVLASGAPLALPAAPTRAQEQVDCALFACIALTFDDGPGDYTAQVLDDLDARRAAATFFLQGYRVAQNPGVVVRMHAEGHEIGNHSWNHPDLTKLTDEEIRDQLERTTKAIQDAAGVRPSTFRPPYGAVDPRVLAQTELPAILWTIDTNDWRIPDDATLLDRAVQQPGPGAIVLLHDVHENTARMTPMIVDGLLGRGFTLVTVQQLLGGTLPAPHTTTSHG